MPLASHLYIARAGLGTYAFSEGMAKCSCVDAVHASMLDWQHEVKFDRWNDAGGMM